MKHRWRWADRVRYHIHFEVLTARTLAALEHIIQSDSTTFRRFIYLVEIDFRSIERALFSVVRRQVTKGNLTWELIRYLLHVKW